MTNEYNPYQAPAVDLSATEIGSTGEPYTRVMLRYLLETRPWVRLLSILGFLGAGLMVLAALVFLAALVAPSTDDSEVGVLIAIIGDALLNAAVLFQLSLYMHRYASAIGQTPLDGGTRTVESALLSQRSFWKTAGIAGSLAVISAAVTAAVFLSWVATNPELD